jgi:hypothetical protein
MSKGKSTGRKTQRIVRMPATKCGHLRKRMQQRLKLSPKSRGK